MNALTPVATALPLAAYDNVEALAAAAFAQARACVPLLEGEVLPAVPPSDRFTVRRLLALIEGRRILDQGSLSDMDVLLDLLARHVAAGTVEVTRSTAEDEGHVGEPRLYIERHQTATAARLAEAAGAVERLRDLAHAVFDLAEAQRSVGRLMNGRR